MVEVKLDFGETTLSGPNGGSPTETDSTYDIQVASY